MGLHVPNLPDAALGIPKGRVAPVHGPVRRIGSGDPRAVDQLQAARRLGEFPVRTPERDFPAQAPRCQMCTSGSATGSAQLRLIRAADTRLETHRRSPFEAGRYEADPHLDEVAEIAVEAVLGRTVIHAPETVLEALDSAPDGCDGHGRIAGFIEPVRGSDAVSGATTEAFRGIYRPQDRPESTISGLRGYGQGGNRCAAESTAVTRSVDGGRSLPPVRVAGGQEAGEIARDGPAEAVPGGARRGVSEASSGTG